MVVMGMRQDDAGNRLAQLRGHSWDALQTKGQPGIDQGKLLLFFDQINIYRNSPGNHVN